MGSLQLACPLCCTETFSCHNSLKYHLLSITENLICPACGERFQRIIDLAMHLDTQCHKSNDQKSIDSFTEPQNNKEEISQSSALTSVMIHIKEEMLEEDTKFKTEEDPLIITDSILAKALLRSPVQKVEVPQNVVAEENADDSDEMGDADMYHCSSCSTNFRYLDEHLAKFHEGHTVYFDETEPPSENLENPTILIADNELDNGKDGKEEGHEENDNSESAKTIDFLNTVQEEECVDKDGRIYLRKVVRIDKFWDNKTQNSDVPDKNNAVETATSIIGISASDTNNPSEVMEIYQCSKCGTKFSTMDRYYDHKCIGMQLDSSKYKRCKYCNACFVNSKYLAMHVKNHKPKKNYTIDPNPPFICDICNTEFSAYKSLRLHRRMHDPIKLKDIEPPSLYGMLGEKLILDDVPREMFICQICCKPYDKEYEEAHKRFHSKEVDFNCEVCNRKFFTQENLDMHMRAHSDSKKFVCSYCKKGFLTNEKLEAHMTTKCQKRQYACQYCGRRFSRPHEKVKHERIHTGEKPHVCEICGKSFRVSYCLTLHMRTHSGTRPYKCDHCGKRFKAHSVYNHHLQTHSEDRKYKCPFCPKTFKTGVQLAGHKNSHIKPFTCTECNRPFASLYAVRAHMDTHQRQNNLKYKCWLCGASYARPFALRDHIKEQHPGDYEEKNLNGETVVFEAADNYSIIESVESNSAILAENDESMLIDIGTATVESIEEITEVEVSNF